VRNDQERLADILWAAVTLDIPHLARQVHDILTEPPPDRP
jgi:hypothetical protein